jgi:hypothetical protein
MEIAIGYSREILVKTTKAIPDTLELCHGGAGVKMLEVKLEALFGRKGGTRSKFRAVNGFRSKAQISPSSVPPIYLWLQYLQFIFSFITGPFLMVYPPICKNASRDILNMYQ